MVRGSQSFFPRPLIPHEIITASAGSGKTWTLIVRYIRLLAMGAEPSSVIALTFSRKAAAEFFQGILSRLAKAAAEESEARALGEAIGMPEKAAGDFRALLRGLIANMHRLSLSTLDSFYVRIAKSFPFELGLGGDFQLLDEYGVLQEKERVYRRVFGHGRDTEPEPESEQRAEFLYAFQQATWGTEENRLRDNLDRFVKDWHGRFLAAPEEEKWGQPDTIWPQGNGLPADPPELGPLAERMRQLLPGLKATDKRQPAEWENFTDWLGNWAAGQDLPYKMAGRLKSLMENWPALKAGGDVSLRFYQRAQEIPAALTAALHEALSAMLAWEWNTALRRTRGIWNILSRYDAAYHELVRRQGKLTFSDVQLVLAGDLVADADRGRAGLSAREESGDRLFIDYRLDARYRHWLLDEFQDTSRVQWRILANLADEVIQDSSGERSFFAVGDTKQSIFVWRGAEPALFQEITQQYNARQEAPLIQLTPLDISYRSAPAVIEMVNEVFTDRDRLQAALQQESLAHWDFRPHEPKHKARKGWSGVIEVPQEKELSREERREAFLAAVAALLTDLNPLERGLSCAVLTLSNNVANELADYLRANTRMNVVSESDAEFAADNPACTALLALLRAAAHPGDEYSWQHVLMTPLAAVLPKGRATENERGEDGAIEGESVKESSGPARGRMVRMVLQQITREGFEATLRHWARELGRVRSLDDFSLSRIDDLCGCARRFDDSGSRDTDAFLAWAQAQRIRETAAGDAVQIMTVHKSKGLTFDVVILPDLHNPSQSRTWNSVAVKRDAQRGIEWLTHVPRKDFALTDPVLAEVVDNAAAEHWRERLSVLYVALTRASHANCVILPASASSRGKEESVSMTNVLRQMLGTSADESEQSRTLMLGGSECAVLWECGEPDWISLHPLRPAPQPLARPVQADLFSGTLPPAQPAPAQRLNRLRPAETSGARLPPGSIFGSARAGARVRGDLIHAALRRVEWLEPKTVTTLEGWWKAQSGSDEDIPLLGQCLTDPACAAVWQRPGGRCTVWRERPFDLVLDGAWLTGVFDRVVIEETAEGRPVRARLVEFKTDAVPPEDLSGALTRHGTQAMLYRRALAALTGLREEHITVSLLFVTGPSLWSL